MKVVPKEKTSVAARDSKRRLENHVTEAQKFKKIAFEAKPRCKIQRTSDRMIDR